jgi:GTP cyclohydrolase II
MAARSLDSTSVRLEAEADIPTRYGALRTVVFRHGGDPGEHVAIVCGDVMRDDVLVRIHSECLTSEVLGSLKCDCAAQLDAALIAIARAGCGVVVYLRQEGRGVGLANKIRAYALQSLGADTVDANRALGLPDDARRYDAAAELLRTLGVRSVRLLTNNPEKVAGLRALGVDVRARVPQVVAVHPLGAAYMRAKRDRMGHLLPND